MQQSFKQLQQTQYNQEQIKQYINEVRQIKEEYSYAPYSKFHVGSLVIDQNDKKYIGVNVENASYGLSICAERNAIFTGVSQGLKKIKLIVVNCNTIKVGSPCGACRQVIAEFSDDKTIIICSNEQDQYEITDLQGILPGAFTPKDLEQPKKGIIY
ncbi:hypothetical protein IMG5_021320 [Ichthyophthirius multifiliis]|uniref:Cytidine deaminase n=1 Tax=Ichthyophthirius multifiliis TaxID=5932 RepID=G0QKS7_ICHMU|nr:hypothetical protein IMG5_021320 [Ichthyophthirius multifiliis]EGR34179.1 hypothetical protein IMG5_021320 [Ichthyophthirius multifiliis]|eukprot:XP_004039483.1 hypothetical protein IMG5_021320 [Ichthyophthirius multifiliis]